MPFFANPSPYTASPSPSGGGWSGWATGSQSSPAAAAGYPAVNPGFKGPVPQQPISRPTNSFNPPGQPTPTAPAPKPPATPKPATPTASPSIAAGAGLTALAYGVPKALKGDFGGAVIDAAIGGAGYAAGAAATAAVIAAAGVTAPAWAPVAGGIVGAATLSAAANALWGDKGGDGSEGAPIPTITEVIYNPGTPGQPGKVPGVIYRFSLNFPNKGTGFSSTWIGPNTPSLTYLTFDSGKLFETRQYRLNNSTTSWVISLPGGGSSSASSVYTRDPSREYYAGFASPSIVRADGTAPSIDATQDPAYIPPSTVASPIYITNNIASGDTLINMNPAPMAGSQKTVLFPPIVPPPPPIVSTPARQNGTQNLAPTPPTTTAGTSTNNLPETGPAVQTTTPTTTTTPNPRPVTSIVGDLQPAPTPGQTPKTTASPTPTKFVSGYRQNDTDTGPNTVTVNNPIVTPTPTPTIKTPTPTETNIKNQIDTQKEEEKNAVQQLIDRILNPHTDPTIESTVPTPTIESKLDNLIDLSEKADVDLTSSLAIIGTLATTAYIDSQTATITTAIANQPSPCTYPSYHPVNVAERAAISGKVDGVNTVLGTVTNVQIAEAKTGINSIISAIGTPIAGGATTIFQGLQTIQQWGVNFSRAIYLDRALNALSFMLQVHNAAMLSRNLAESVGQLIDSTLTALNLKNEDDEFLNIPAIIGDSVTNFIKSIIGEEVFNGISREWKLLSAIYTTAINVYEMALSSLSGLAEGIQVAGQYTGKIGNALKRGGVVLENAYEWMDENMRIKMGKVGWLDKVAEGLETTTDIVEDVTEVPEQAIEIQDNYKEAKEALQEIKTTIAQNEDTALGQFLADKEASDPGDIPDQAVPPSSL